MPITFGITCIEFSNYLVSVDVTPLSHVKASSDSAIDLVLTNALGARSTLKFTVVSRIKIAS